VLPHLQLLLIVNALEWEQSCRQLAYVFVACASSFVFCTPASPAALLIEVGLGLPKPINGGGPIDITAYPKSLLKL